MPGTELYALIYVEDVDLVADWVVDNLGFVDNWRAPGETGVTEHAELLWGTTRVSINVKASHGDVYSPSSVAVSVPDREAVDRIHAHIAGRLDGVPAPEESRIAYGFTVLDPVDNEWWVHAETGFLDEFRKIK